MKYDVWFYNLGIKIERLPNVAISIFGTDIYWYAIIINLGIILGLIYVVYEAKKTNQNKDNYINFLLYALISAIVSARIYYVVFSWEYYKNDLLSIFNIRQGGIAIYGAIIGGLICSIIYTKVKKINFWLFVDTLSPGLVLGQAIGRWGNFFNREAHGGYTDNLFAMRYLKEGWNFNVPEEAQVVIDGITYVQVHPTFLYESLFNISIFIFIFFYRRYKKFDGEIFILYLFLYGIGRFFIESLRIDQLQIGSSGIAISQVVSLVIIIFSISYYAHSIKNKKC